LSAHVLLRQWSVHAKHRHRSAREMRRRRSGAWLLGAGLMGAGLEEQA